MPGARPLQETTKQTGAHESVNIEQRHRDFDRISVALAYLDDHYQDQPGLDQIADSAGLSAFHFQRLFSDWVGISPKKFLQSLSLEHAKQSLAQYASVLDAAYDAGLSGPGRLHDLFVTSEAVTPGEYKSKGAGVTIRYGYHPSPFGECLLLITDRGVCGLAFVIDDDREDAFEHLSSGWCGAKFEFDAAATGAYMDRIFGGPGGRPRKGGAPLRLILRGSVFQTKVWRALLAVPPGMLTTYQDIARRIGYPAGAARAVGTANGSNLISYLIPCHRVIRKSGAIGGYRWGRSRKLAMIGWEAALSEGEGEMDRV
ncbi:MAG: methylated-DNA--[protein]-cysteine S-methyltransferase [Alphaproteobacteria bacterium]|nr:methylated-DNA--[protein]-cysteine S-methyltransferase [Alphaproteobacteria bacterium]